MHVGLMPCPFCKSSLIELRTYTSSDYVDYAYTCDRCGLTGPRSMLVQDARAVWNDLPRMLRMASTQSTNSLYPLDEMQEQIANLVIRMDCLGDRVEKLEFEFGNSST